jgi:hypothetical protein
MSTRPGIVPGCRALPYFDEAVWIAARFPNIYLSLASNLDFTLIAPRVVQQQVGQLLRGSLDDSATLRCSRDGDAASAPEFEQSLVAERS